MRCLWIICYDIADDRRRLKVFRLLKDVGTAVQLSVFESWLNRQELLALRANLLSVIVARDGDTIRWYPLCARCEGEVATPAEQGRQHNLCYFIV